MRVHTKRRTSNVTVVESFRIFTWVDRWDGCHTYIHLSLSNHGEVGWHLVSQYLMCVAGCCDLHGQSRNINSACDEFGSTVRCDSNPGVALQSVFGAGIEAPLQLELRSVRRGLR